MAIAFPPMLSMDDLQNLPELYYDVDEADDHWSDIIPPRSALTFAVVYDPEHDFMAFSDANILGFNSKQSSCYLLVPQDTSPSRAMTPRNVSRASSEYFDASEEPMEEVMKSYTMEHTSISGLTQTSSTLGGLDVYQRGASLAQTHIRQPIYSILEFEAGFNLDLKELGTTSMYQIVLSRKEK
ncbi:hypothetical protein CPB83DRAFT_607236 [Crepidotus variabilis]|uniref:Uncharacterized protein n=1 Tax=Crepidotus variabilis TaxID=179855 RepID=A0A9P6E8R0_9AGAR|nr:hypothetical protein CPB83DRAFT_607236 [Crepidotus variabilis]